MYLLPRRKPDSPVRRRQARPESCDSSFWWWFWTCPDQQYPRSVAWVWFNRWFRFYRHNLSRSSPCDFPQNNPRHISARYYSSLLLSHRLSRSSAKNQMLLHHNRTASLKPPAYYNKPKNITLTHTLATTLLLTCIVLDPSAKLSLYCVPIFSGRCQPSRIWGRLPHWPPDHACWGSFQLFLLMLLGTYYWAFWLCMLDEANLAPSAHLPCRISV